MKHLEYLKVDCTSPCERWEQLKIEHFPKLEIIQYHFFGDHFRKSIRAQLPVKPFVDLPSKNLKEVRLYFGRYCVMNDEYMLDRLNCKIVPRYEIKLNLFEIESKIPQRNIKLDYNDKSSFQKFLKEVNRSYWNHFRNRGV